MFISELNIWSLLVKAAVFLGVGPTLNETLVLHIVMHQHSFLILISNFLLILNEFRCNGEGGDLLFFSSHISHCKSSLYLLQHPSYLTSWLLRSFLGNACITCGYFSRTMYTSLWLSFKWVLFIIWIFDFVSFETVIMGKFHIHFDVASRPNSFF